MSLTSQWAKGQITTDQLISQGAADLYKGYQFFAHLPFAATLVGWTLDQMAAFITRSTGSSLFAVNIIDAIKIELAAISGQKFPASQPAQPSE